MAAKFETLNMAAEKLCISQPAVTRGIQRLQKYYNIKLFKRLGRKLELTYAGQGLYEIAEKIFELDGMADEYIREFQQHKRGHIRIVASETFSTFYLPFIINQFSRSNQRVRITVNTLTNKEVIRKTVDRGSDVGFISCPIRHGKLVVETILEENLVIIMPPGHPFVEKDYLEPEDLEGQSVVMHERGSILQIIIDALIKKKDIALKKYIEFSNNESVKQAVVADVGIALISEKVVAEEIRSGKLIALPLSDVSTKRQFYIIYRKDKIITDLLEHFINTVHQWAAEITRDLCGNYP